MFQVATVIVAMQEKYRQSATSTSLEGVLPRAVRSAELDGSLSSVGRGWPVRTGVNGPLMAHPEAWVWALVRASSRLVRCSRTAGTWRAGDCKCG